MAGRAERRPAGLIGIGVWYGGLAVITFIIVATDPWNTAKALTWLSGSTYGRSAAQVVPVALALLLLTPVVVRARRELDLLTLDDDTPRLLGVRLERTRLVALAAAALLTATAVVSLADTLGRTVIAPAQIPAGLVTAMVGAPYFVWLLWRTRGPVVAR